MPLPCRSSIARGGLSHINGGSVAGSDARTPSRPAPPGQTGLGATIHIGVCAGRRGAQWMSKAFAIAGDVENGFEAAGFPRLCYTYYSSSPGVVHAGPALGYTYVIFNATFMLIL